MMLFISGAELVFVFFIVLLVFGADRIPSLAKTLAKGMTQVRQASRDIKNEIQNTIDVEESTKSITQGIEKVVDILRFSRFTRYEDLIKIYCSPSIE